MYSHESPENVYKLRGEAVAYDPNEVRHVLRVPTAYGEYKYSDDYHDGERDAVKRGRNYIEYRDLDGKWQRFYPDIMKDVTLKNYTAPEIAKALGRKLLKTAKTVK